MVKSIGLADFIENMDPKLKNLYQQILTLFIVIMMGYATVTFFFSVFLEGKSFISWFSSDYFITSIIVIVLIVVCNGVLKGKEFKIPEEFKKKEGESKQFNIPDTWGVKGQIKKEHKQNPKLSIKTKGKKSHKGSWNCPQCGFLAIGKECPKCGHRR